MVDQNSDLKEVGIEEHPMVEEKVEETVAEPVAEPAEVAEPQAE